MNDRRRTWIRIGAALSGIEHLRPEPALQGRVEGDASRLYDDAARIELAAQAI